MPEFDPGPPVQVAEIFARVPDYAPFKEFFWFDWGPVFYRGRLDRTARVLCVGSDPGPTERVALRTLVGDAGQRVQGFLAKLGLTHSYVCLNAFVFALFPSRASSAGAVLRAQQHVQWRNELFDAVSGPSLQAVVAFGTIARRAVQLWPGSARLPVFNIPHPSSRDEQQLLDAWRDAITQLRALVTPDPDGNVGAPNYGAAFAEADYARVPFRDLRFGVPEWLGDDSAGRRTVPPRRNSVHRPQPDDGHTLIWTAPTS